MTWGQEGFETLEERVGRGGQQTRVESAYEYPHPVVILVQCPAPFGPDRPNGKARKQLQRPTLIAVSIFLKPNTILCRLLSTSKRGNCVVCCPLFDFNSFQSVRFYAKLILIKLIQVLQQFCFKNILCLRVVLYDRKRKLL